MKKILLIIIILITCCGCYDYEEITDTSIVVGMSLEKDSENYLVNAEILSLDEENKSYVISDTGKNVADAIKNLEDKIAKNVKYSHLKVLLINKSIDLDEIKDYFLRNFRFTNNFYLFYSDDFLKDILENNDNEQINSFVIMNLVNETNSNILLNTKDAFDFNMAKIMEGKDFVIPNIKLEDKQIVLNGMSVYKKNEVKFYLDENDTKIYGLLKKKIKNNLIVNNNDAIEIIDSSIKLKYDNAFVYDIFLEASIKMLNSTNDINEAEKIFEQYLKSEISKLIDKCYLNDTDILDFKSIKNTFKEDYKVSVKINIKENN